MELTRLGCWLVVLSLAMILELSAHSRAQGPGRTKEPARPTTKPLRAADSDSPLPEGWPDATVPGKIEVKSYPAYRSAVAEARGASTRADGVLFFSLFNHIRKSGIEMTAPVVNTYKTPELLQTPGGTGEMSLGLRPPAPR